MPDEDEPRGWTLRTEPPEPRPFVRRLAVVALVLMTLAIFTGLGGVCLAFGPTRHFGHSFALSDSDSMSFLKPRFWIGAIIGAVLGVAFLIAVDLASRPRTGKPPAPKHKPDRQRWELH